jgi:hypothetical protein
MVEAQLPHLRSAVLRIPKQLQCAIDARANACRDLR